MNENQIAPTRIRKRKNYFALSRSQKKKSKNLIKAEALNGLNRFCKSMGLKINEMKLGPVESEESENEIEIDISKFNLTNKYKKFVYLVMKDINNISKRKYKILRKLFSSHHITKLPSHQDVDKIQKDLNNYFTLNSNQFGYFVDPIQKIKFACKNFLHKNRKYSGEKFRIKLSADSVQISRKNIYLLNLTFTLLDDFKTCKSVYGHFILGNVFFYKHS